MKDKSLNILKNLIIIMGVTLVLGVLMLFRLIATQVKTATQLCDNQEMNIEGTIKQMSTEKNKIFLLVEHQNKQKIVYFDYCDSAKQKEITF